MGDTTKLDIAADEGARTLHFKISGPIDSAQLTDLIIAAYQAHRAHWTYRRIFDYRRASGLYDFPEIERLLAWWYDASREVAICPFVAVITDDALLDFRSRAYDGQRTTGEIRSFDDLREALAWLDRVAPI